MSILSATNLCKSFRDFHAVKNMSLHLEAGEIVGFLGPNGAGKSTTMKMLTGHLWADSGTISINGSDPLSAPLLCKQNIGYLPQRLPLYADMTPWAYLDHIARLKNIPRNQRRREIHDAIQACDIEPVSKRPIRTLSGGNQQRVGLAQALLGSPPILILDEPTAGLDPAQIANFRDLLRGLGGKHSVLLSTHILGEVEACCDRVIIVQQGSILLEATVDELKARAREKVTCACAYVQVTAANLLHSASLSTG